MTPDSGFPVPGFYEDRGGRGTFTTGWSGRAYEEGDDISFVARGSGGELELVRARIARILPGRRDGRWSMEVEVVEG